jgi:hypothetical protein
LAWYFLNVIDSRLPALHVCHVLGPDNSEWVVHRVECSCRWHWLRRYHWDNVGVYQRSQISKLLDTLGADPPLELE